LSFALFFIVFNLLCPAAFFMNTLYIDTPSIDLYPIYLILKVKVIWLHPPENPRRIGEMAFSVKTITFSHFDPETRPRARRLAAKARPPTPNAPVLGLHAQLPMSRALVLAPLAAMLAAFARVRTIQAGGTEDRQTLQILKNKSNTQFQAECLAQV
jgi:hypothetical protein